MAGLVDCAHGSTRVLAMAGRVRAARRKNVDAALAPRRKLAQSQEAVHEFAGEHKQRTAERPH